MKMQFLALVIAVIILTACGTSIEIPPKALPMPTPAFNIGDAGTDVSSNKSSGLPCDYPIDRELIYQVGWEMGWLGGPMDSRAPPGSEGERKFQEGYIAGSWAKRHLQDCPKEEELTSPHTITITAE